MEIIGQFAMSRSLKKILVKAVAQQLTDYVVSDQLFESYNLDFEFVVALKLQFLNKSMITNLPLMPPFLLYST